MTDIAPKINGLRFIAPTKETTLNRGQKALLDAIRDCVKNSKSLDWDRIVELYSANVRDQYQHFFYDFKEGGNVYDMVNVLEAYRTSSSVWHSRIRQLVKAWFLHNIGILGKDEWLTPPSIIKALGEFDLDPCAPIERPWPTAKNHFTILNGLNGGLDMKWEGRVWLNPPYGKYVWSWLEKLAIHKNGIALIFARTGVPNFQRIVFNQAQSVLFLKGRIHFHHVNGDRAAHNCGADSILIAYDIANSEVLRQCSLQGKFIKL